MAWCLSNREDQLLVRQYFKQIYLKVGAITPQWFMSDDAEQFFSAWTAVFGMGPQKLLCAWHVDRAWRGGLSHIQSKETQATVYATLRTLMEETDVKKFEEQLHETVQQLQSSHETKKFSQYFIQYYYFRPKQWVVCYCTNAGINTNMYVEAFQNQLTCKRNSFLQSYSNIFLY